MLETFPRLAETAIRSAALSGGEQQMLAIDARWHAAVLLLDEPSMELAPMVISQIFKIIAEINSQGTTVLLVEQNAQQALSRSIAYILETGEVTRTGNARRRWPTTAFAPPTSALPSGGLATRSRRAPT